VTFRSTSSAQSQGLGDRRLGGATLVGPAQKRLESFDEQLLITGQLVAGDDVGGLGGGEAGLRPQPLDQLSLRLRGRGIIPDAGEPLELCVDSALGHDELDCITKS
jgi:hypothetical protein